ncbi:MAG: tetratricopeptide repeat protein [Treponema sp.]|jgi:tetratricopeptide (TPR) repeat protein|nr:tetratricopeptide repeat protein [Treponema sp.]
MKLDPILTRAVRVLWRGKYGDVISLLEPEVVRYHDSFNYYYILGSACLRAGDLGGAFTYYKRAREIKMLEPLVLLGMAVYYLYRGDTGKVVDLYLEVLDLDPRNRIAKRGLQVLRKHGGADGIQGWIDSGKAPRLFPPVPKPPLRLIPMVIPAALVLLALMGGILAKKGLFPLGAESERAGLPGITLEREDREMPVQIGGTYRYILTRKEALDLYETGRRLFTGHRDESARVSLNRLIESNASDTLKNRARLLISYMEVPGFDNLRDRFSFAEVRQDPILYRDCYVIWRGMATNLNAGEAVTAFDFLIGYDTRAKLEGIVQVRFDSSLSLDPERPLEVLGRVIPISEAGEEGIRLEGIALHQASSLGR